MCSETLGCLSFWAKSNLTILLIPDFYFELLAEKSRLLRESVAGQSHLHLPGATGTLFPADTEIKRHWNKTITLGDIMPSGLCSMSVFREIILNNFQWFHQETEDWMPWSCQETCSCLIRMPMCWGSKVTTGTAVVLRSKEIFATMTAFTSTKFTHVSRKGAGNYIVNTE